MGRKGHVGKVEVRLNQDTWAPDIIAACSCLAEVTTVMSASALEDAATGSAVKSKCRETCESRLVLDAATASSQAFCNQEQLICACAALFGHSVESKETVHSLQLLIHRLWPESWRANACANTAICKYTYACLLMLVH